jgi:hypothetical protein
MLPFETDGNRRIDPIGVRQRRHLAGTCDVQAVRYTERYNRRSAGRPFATASRNLVRSCSASYRKPPAPARRSGCIKIG